MPTWQILRPILISTAVWAGIIVLSSYLFGADAASRALLVAFSLSNIAVLTVLGLIALIAIRFKPAGIILSVVAAVAIWFLIRFGLPISYLLLVNGPSGEESTLPGVWKTFAALAAARGPAGRAGAAIAVLICALFIDKALRAIGYPGARVHSERHRRAILLQRLTLAALSTVGMGLAVLAPLGVGGVILLIVGLDLFIGLSIAILSWRFALDVYRTAAVATALREPRSVVEPWAFHATDIHLTALGVERAEGGEGGRQRFEALVRSASASNTAVLLLTGDITDHGEAAEWNAAAEILSPLREAKLPILLAPGNHDLSFAYARKEQFYARVAEHGFGKPGLYQYLYGRRLLDYLRFQNSLCPGIVLADGQVLSELTTGMFALLDAERDLFRRVASAGRLDETVLNTYLDDLMARGLMHGSRRDGYAVILRGDARHHIGGFNLVQCEIAEGFVGLSVADKIFPMRYLDPENDAEIFMLNSVVVDDSLIASASGELAEAQAERFGAMVTASTARNIVVLIHHAPFRWADEPQPTFLGQDSLRWSSLAMSNNSAKQFIEPLAAALDKGRSVVFCCGHRHGGPEKKTTLGTWRGVLISEGASLAESDAAISALGFTPHGIAARLISSE